MGRRSNKTGAAARLGTINRGVGHNIKKHSAMPIKRKRPVQKTKKKVGARDAALFSVKFSASNCQTSGNTESSGDRRFFRSRAAGRRPTVSLNSAARPTPSAVEVNNNKCVIVVAGGGGDCGKLSRDFTKTSQTQQEHTLRRSPRKSMTQQQQQHYQQQQQQESSPQQQQQLLRRSPRKSAGGRLSGVHVAMGRPTRLLLPSQSPRKSASLSTGTGGSVTSTSSVCVSPHTTQPPVRRTSPRKQPSNLQRLDTCTSSSEQLLMMEVEEDKENESPDHSSSSSSSVTKQHKLKNPKFYSIFYREQRRDGLDDVMMGASETPSTSGTSSPSSVAVKATSKRRAGNSSSSCARQLVIDAGQKKFGAVTCDTCGLVYCAGDEHDAALHAQHHAGLHNELQFPGWKRERVVAEFMDGRVLMVSGGDPQYAWRKAAAVLRVVDSELGFWGHSNGGGGDGSQIGDTLFQDRRTKVFLYVGERQVRGCLVVEPVDEAYRVTCSQSTSPEQHRGDEGGTQMAPNSSSNQPPTCSDDVCACVCGVSRVWTHYQHRRRGIASRLLNAVRCNFMMVPLTWNDVAFSDPTPAGFQFATAITGTASFLVYRH